MAERKLRLTPAAEAKRWLRRHLVRQRQAISPREADRRSALAAHAFVTSAPYRRARTVALFISFGSEIRTEDIIHDAWSKAKEVVIPVTALGFDRPYFAHFRKGDRLLKTSYGPMELVENVRPLDFRRIDLVVVPGLAFDGDGYRLGYGGGVYDRLLGKTPSALHVGLYYDQQRVAHLPRERHDRPLAGVVTESGFSATADLTK